MAASTIGLILAAVSTAATAYSAWSSEQSAEKTEKRNERALAAQAERARKAAELRAQDEEKRHRRVLAAQRAMYGRAGVTQEGAPLLVEIESLAESEEQLRRIREGGAIEASRLLDEARWRGQLAKKHETAGYLGAGSALISGVHSIGKAAKWWS